MEKLSFVSYVAKCVLGGEIAYVLCLLGGYLPYRTAEGTALHHALFETIPGFVWGSFASALWGAVVVAVASFVFGAYMVWMHNSSLTSSQ